MNSRLEEKRKRLEKALEHGVVMIHFDPRQPGVKVPEQYKQEFQLRLNLSFRFEPPDLEINNWGVRETLSFGGKKYPVAVPWSSIFAMTGTQRSDAWLFPEDVPPELLEAAAEHLQFETSKADSNTAHAKPISASQPQFGYLRLVDSGPLPQSTKVEVSKENVVASQESKSSSENKTNRSHLRLVK